MRLSASSRSLASAPGCPRHPACAFNNETLLQGKARSLLARVPAAPPNCSSGRVRAVRHRSSAARAYTARDGRFLFQAAACTVFLAGGSMIPGVDVRPIKVKARSAGAPVRRTLSVGKPQHAGEEPAFENRWAQGGYFPGESNWRHGARARCGAARRS